MGRACGVTTSTARACSCKAYSLIARRVTSSVLEGGWRRIRAGTEHAQLAVQGDEMRGTVLLGVILLIAGLAGLAWPVISYTKTEKVVDLGPIEVTADREKHVPVPPIVGGLAAVAGLVIIVTSSRKP
jgi:hypothetical protein